MKKFLIVIISFTAMFSNAQIVFESAYDSSSNIIGSTSSNMDGINQLMLINFEVSGYCYVKINRSGKYICIYKMDHSLLKKIDCSSFPLLYGVSLGEIIYLSEQLFNLDDKIEFLYGWIDQTTTPTAYYTGIYNENGQLLFSDSCAPLIKSNVPLQQYPIYNTPEGTKMILSYPNGQAKVFSLPGTLTTSIAEANNNLISQSSLSNPYPNPVSNTTKVDYTLPEGIEVGELVFYDMQGIEVKRYRVDRTFNTLLISTSDIPAGTYFYQLQTAKDKTAGKKMIVIK